MLPCAHPAADPTKTYMTLLCFLQSVQSKGSVRLASADYRDAPLSDPNFLDSDFDRLNAVQTVRQIMQFVKTPLLAEKVIEPLDVPPSESDADILAWVSASPVTIPASILSYKLAYDLLCTLIRLLILSYIFLCIFRCMAMAITSFPWSHPIHSTFLFLHHKFAAREYRNETILHAFH